MLQRSVDRHERLHEFWKKINSAFGLMFGIINVLDVTTMLGFVMTIVGILKADLVRGLDSYIILVLRLLQVVVVGIRLILMTIPMIL